MTGLPNVTFEVAFERAQEPAGTIAEDEGMAQQKDSGKVGIPPMTPPNQGRIEQLPTDSEGEE